MFRTMFSVANLTVDYCVSPWEFFFLSSPFPLPFSALSCYLSHLLLASLPLIIYCVHSYSLCVCWFYFFLSIDSFSFLFSVPVRNIRSQLTLWSRSIALQSISSMHTLSGAGVYVSHCHRNHIFLCFM